MGEVMEKLEFQTIYETFQPRIFRYLKRLAGQYEAEDLTQEVFAKVSQAFKNFRRESQLSTWIYRIATNAALDRLRNPFFQRMGRAKTIEGKMEIEDADWTGEKRPSPERELIKKEMNECIRDFIENLSPHHRAVIILSEIEGLENQKIAEILGVTLDTVKIRLHRARTKLRKELEGHCSFYRDERNELACDLKSAFGEFRKRY